MFFGRQLNSFKSAFFESFFQEYHQSWRFVGPDLGSNCLRRLSVDDTSRQRVKICLLLTTNKDDFCRLLTNSMEFMKEVFEKVNLKKANPADDKS